MIRDRRISISRAALVHAIVVYLPPAAAATGVALLAYLLVQQSLRLLNYGRRTPLSVLLAHLAFGFILGAFYRLR